MSDILPRIELHDILPYLPSAMGALLGTRYSKATTFRERLLSWVLAMSFGFYIGGALGEYFSLGQTTTYGVMFGMSSLGMEVFAFLIAMFREAVISPLSTFGKYLDAILGRRPL